MEAQEPTLRGMVAQFSWPTAPRFPDVRGAVTDILRSATGEPEQWSWDSNPSNPVISVWNEDRRLRLFMSGGRFDVVSEMPEDPVNVVREVLGPVMETLHLPAVERVGATCLWVLASPTLDDASAVVERHLGAAQLRDVLSPIGGRPSEFSVRAAFDQDESSTRIWIEPVTVDELLEDHLITEFDTGELPPAAIVATLRRTRDLDASPSEAVAEASRILEAIRGAGDRLLVSLETA